MLAFLKAGEYTRNGWASQTPMPRPREGSTSPHDRVRVWMNPALVASLRSGNGKDLMAPPHTQGSMTVKEIYEGMGTTPVGRAAMLKFGSAKDDWIYFCYGPTGRCDTGKDYSEQAPAYVRSFGGGPGCPFCHGGLIFTAPPN
jgi:hypothetical protein